MSGPMKQPNVTVYGSRNCPETTRALKFLDSQEIQYEFKDLDESPELNAYVADLNGGNHVMPTIQIDNEILINPSERELKTACQQAAAERP
jgi:glutaredoxin